MSETEELARLAMGGRAMRRKRLSRALLARLIGDRYGAEDEDIEGEEEGRRIVRLLIGSRLLRRRRLRNLLLAHLLRERGEAEEEEDEGEEASGEEDSDKERRLVRLLIGSRILRRRRVRRMLLAHLLRERGEAGEEEDEGEDEFAEGGDNEQRLLRLLVGHRARQGKRARRMLMAHLLREREEA